MKTLLDKMRTDGPTEVLENAEPTCNHSHPFLWAQPLPCMISRDLWPKALRMASVGSHSREGLVKSSWSSWDCLNTKDAQVRKVPGEEGKCRKPQGLTLRPGDEL